MTRQRKLYISAATLALSIVSGVVIVSIVGTKAERAFGRIKVGMRPVEVAEAIGQPPDQFDVRAMPRCYAVVERGLPLLEYPAGSIVLATDEEWSIDDWTIVVSYDQSFKVCAYYLLYHRQSLLDRLKAHIGW